MFSFLIGFALLTAGGQHAPPPSCPATDPRVEQQIRMMLSTQSSRQTMGVPSTVTAEDLRLLTDNSHAAICQQLAPRVFVRRSDGFSMRHAYFTSGGYYFVGAAVVDGQGRYVPRKGRLWVFAPDLSGGQTYVL